MAKEKAKKAAGKKSSKAPKTAKVFRDDIIIAGDDGMLYKIPMADLKNEYAIPKKEARSQYKKVLNLLEAGVQLAAIPVSKEDGGAHAQGDMMCYLLNLAGLRTDTTWEKD